MAKLLRLSLLGVLCLLASPVLGQTVVVPDCAVGVAPAYNAGARNVPYAVSPNGQPCGGGSGAAAGQLQGNVAAATADSGNPVKIGGVYTSNPPTYGQNQRVDALYGLRGAQATQLMVPDTTTTIAAGATADGVPASTAGLTTRAFGSVYNGTTWDREFTCSSSAIVNVTAAATTEIVPLTAAQTIRVCSFVITGSAAATVATFVYGTGASCATGQTALTGAMRIAIDNNITLAAGQGSLFRTASANALCLTAATGNVTGFVTYAKF